VSHSGTDPCRLYREQELSLAAPERLILLAYDTALHACRSGRRGLLIRCLEELLGGLDLDQGEVAARFLRLYEYLLHEAREGRLTEVEPFLRELRDTWWAAVAPGPSKPADARTPGDAAEAGGR
jgi:flagellin-specific chaperone FliS